MHVICICFCAFLLNRHHKPYGLHIEKHLPGRLTATVIFAITFSRCISKTCRQYLKRTVCLKRCSRIDWNIVTAFLGKQGFTLKALAASRRVQCAQRPNCIRCLWHRSFASPPFNCLRNGSTTGRRLERNGKERNTTGAGCLMLTAVTG